MRPHGRDGRAAGRAVPARSRSPPRGGQLPSARHFREGGAAGTEEGGREGEGAVRVRAAGDRWG